MDSGNTVWVTGSKGFLGSVVCHSFEQAGFTVVGTDEELSVCEPERLEAFVEEVRPAVVVNCAGIRRDATTMGTRAKAYEVNALGALPWRRTSSAPPWCRYRPTTCIPPSSTSR